MKKEEIRYVKTAFLEWIMNVSDYDPDCRQVVIGLEHIVDFVNNLDECFVEVDE